MIYQGMAFFVLLWFYSVYLGKMSAQKKKGIQTDQMAKGKKDKTTFWIEGIMKLAVWTMKDSWRAGIAENEKTNFVKTGIYSVSRNPAFLGFDLMYTGICVLFFNPVLLIFTVWAVGMLHLQILQEEKFLPSVFGAEYMKYKAQVFRYIGRRKISREEAEETETTE